MRLFVLQPFWVKFTNQYSWSVRVQCSWGSGTAVHCAHWTWRFNFRALIAFRHPLMIGFTSATPLDGSIKINLPSCSSSCEALHQHAARNHYEQSMCNNQWSSTSLRFHVQSSNLLSPPLLILRSCTVPWSECTFVGRLPMVQRYFHDSKSVEYVRIRSFSYSVFFINRHIWNVASVFFWNALGWRLRA